MLKHAERLEAAHPWLKELIEMVSEEYSCVVICSHRGEIDQMAAFASGASKLQFPMSKHNLLPSLAVDVAPWFRDKPHIRWKDKESFYHFAGFVSCAAWRLGMKIRWGGDWDNDKDFHDQSFNDLVHFELIIQELSFEKRG